MDFGSEGISHKTGLSSSNLEKGDGHGEKDHSPVTDPLQRPEKLHKNGSSSAGSTDDFEHISSDSYPVGSGAGENLLHDFLGASQTQYDNLKSDIGRDFSQMKTAAKEIPADFMSTFDDRIAQTRDFMAAERQGFAAPTPSIPKPKQQSLFEADVPIKEPAPAAPVKEKPADTLNIFDSPVKKITKEDNEKFISSEDLLGITADELMDDPIPKKPEEPVSFVPIIPKPAAPVIAAPVVSLPKDEPKLPEPVPKVVAKPAAVVAPPKPIEPVKLPTVEPPRPSAPPAQKQPSSTPMISAEEMFCRFGLDAWFKPDRLHPVVESLIYWRDVKKSGIVFGAGLVILLAISCFSVISVFAYLSLLTLAGTVAFRIYKNVLGAIQKTSEGHPFKDYLELDLTISQEKAQNVVTIVVAHFNGFICELRRLFLVDDLVDSLKFGVILWTLTYIGAWFNGMTLVILAFVALFTLPKVYENNKQSIDTYLDLVRSKFLEITDKVKAAIPIGKKPETDKDK